MKHLSSRSKIPLIFAIFVTLFVTMACACNLFTLTPTAVTQPPASSSHTPEEQANEGTHTYRQVTEEFSCSAADPSTQDLPFEVNLLTEAVEIIPVQTPSGGHVYPRVAPNTYVREDGNYRITITFTADGFVLFSELTEDSGQTYNPCLRYTRTLLH